MKPIILTATRGGTYSEAHDEPVYVNPEQIQQFGCYGQGDTRTYIDFGEPDHSLWVRDSPQRIMDLLAWHRDSVRAEERDGVHP